MTAKKPHDAAENEAAALQTDGPVERADTDNSEGLHPAGLQDPPKPKQTVPFDSAPQVAYTDNSDGLNPAGGTPEDYAVTALCVDGPFKGEYQTHTGKSFVHVTHEGGDGPLTEAGHPVTSAVRYKLSSRDGTPIWTCGES